MNKINRSYLKKIRYAVQWSFFFFIVYAGYRFYLFVEHFITGKTPLVERPPLVDGFLPIGALMGIKLWLFGGIFDRIHPSAIVILISAIILSLIFKKSFCGYICPVGALSEAAFKAGGKIFGRNPTMPKFLDYPLRGAKYILMGFFIYIVFVKMSAGDISAFLDEPYWKVADVKMLFFFTYMTALTFYVLSGLFALSLIFKNFWCRYLCPYGALLGILSFLSPFKITRDENACIHCGKCTMNCPQSLPVESKLRIKSPECTGCLTCVSLCPAGGALDMALPNKKAIKPLIYIALAMVLFFAIIKTGKLTGHWHSNVSYEQYKALIPEARGFEHP